MKEVKDFAGALMYSALVAIMSALAVFCESLSIAINSISLLSRYSQDRILRA